MVHFLASVVACHPILHILVVVNWQLSKQGIRWPVSRDHTVGSVDPSRLLVHVFLSLPLTSFLFSTDRKLNSNYWISLLLCFFINGSSALSWIYLYNDVNATRAVIGRCPWSIRVQIHGWHHWKLVFFVCSTWHAVLKMFVRLFEIEASESFGKSLAGAIYKEEKWRNWDQKSYWLLDNA